MHYSGLGTMKFYKGRLNGNKYEDLIEGSLIKTFTKLRLSKDNTVFQQDNAPCHRKDNYHEALFERMRINKLSSWPSCSPDLNPLENL